MSKPKAYEIIVTGTCVVFVGSASNIQEACDMALESIRQGDFSDTTCTPSALYSETDTDSSRRHADVRVAAGE